MISIWCCTCARCGKEIADGDRQALDFKRGGWQYDRETREWTCDECMEKESREAEATTTQKRRDAK